jgi:pimeloyl-ACP methyl ester carboxylesterase
MLVIEVDGYRLAYLAPRGLPPRGEPTVLLVHGVGGSAVQFEPVLERLRRDVVPVAVDLPGHGRSDGVVLSSVQALVAVLTSFLAAFRIERLACYVGHSFGGLIGLELARQHPARVDRLVLLASAARLRLHPDLLEQAATGRWELARFERSFAGDVPASQRRAVLDDLTRLRLGPDRQALATLGRASVQDLDSIRAPALCVVPDEDVILAPRHGAALAAGLPDARLVRVPGAGHYVHVERPDVVASALNAFMGARRVAARRRRVPPTRSARRPRFQPV